MPLSLIAALLAAAPGAVHVAGPRGICEAIEAGVRHERPDVVLTATATAAEWVFVVDDRGVGWRLSLLEGGRPIETRALGADREPAVRLAVLLVVSRLDDDASRSDAPPRPPSARTTTTTGPATGPATAPRPRARSDWQLEAAIDAALSAGQRLSLAVAVQRRWGPWRLGARGLIGLCCDIDGDGMEATRTSFSALLEVGRVVLDRPVELAVAVAGGYAQEVLDVTASDQVFAGPAAPEQTIARDVQGRAFVAATWSILDDADVRVTAAVGAEAHPGVWSVRLPSPYGDGRTPIERPVIAPFGTLGLTWSIW